MWETIAALPVAVQISVPITIAILLIIIALWGKVNIKWGEYKIGFGTAPKRRSCNDCMLLTFSKREEFELKCRKIENSILKSQMNFSEHKLESILFELSQDYREHLKLKRQGTPDLEREHHDSTIYEEILKQGLSIAKDEVRRSFKENGFHELDGHEFQTYVKTKSVDLLNRVRAYLINRYPTMNMIIGIDERLERLNVNKIEDVCFDIYVNAKTVRLKAEEDIKVIEKEFIDSIHSIIKEEDENA